VEAALTVSSRQAQWYNRTLSAGALFVLTLVCGCGDSPQAPADLSKAPWLDPLVQIEGLKSSDARIRGASVRNLGHIGAAAADAIPQLEKLAKDDPEPKIRDSASKAVEKIRSAAD
jgi:hypothetical protein